jgi:hypothetical protein
MDKNLKYCNQNHCTYPCKECEKAARPMTEKAISVLLLKNPNELLKVLGAFDLPVRMYENVKI